ncbi:MAG: beta-N-acetylhexosaminidase [Pseudomonadota bacterium]|nr:beta-N-acetylhexosaminidase [Pseudomonadota bacterium]
MRVRSARPALVLLLALAACKPPVAAEGELPFPSLIPAPVLLDQFDGRYTLDATTRIHAPGDPDGDAVADLLAEALRPATGLALEVVEDGGDDGIELVLDPTLDLPAEGYTVDVDETGVTIAAGDVAGLFHGTQTFRQLLPPQVYAVTAVDDVVWELPAVSIEDSPRFGWRGAMLDVARHFYTVAEVERQIDLLALHKLNRLHLHLTDDQGWRIEIRAWPELTEVGGSTEVGGGEGGYYTQGDYAALVEYAAARQVVVIPEIDFPGHANAALSSYGELNESGAPVAPYTGTGVISTPLWLDGPDTHRFVTDVWGEVAALTPGPWMHVGGDEAVDISQADYDTFVGWLQTVSSDNGKTMIGWDEIGPVPLDAPFVAQHWFDEDNALAAVAQGAQLVSSPAEHTYLDMRHDSSADYGQVWAGRIDVERAYDWEPVPEGLAEGDVLGVEGALWTEYVDTEEKLDFMLWPRLVAHAEVGWTADEGRVWEDFRERLGHHGARLYVLDVGFYDSSEMEWEKP